jgi:phenylacetic acid degradation operon negative regulatory protein
VRKKRQLDDPRSLGEPVKGAVVFAFGMVGPDRVTIPGPALVAMLGALGFGEATARATILRMRRDGRLRSIRRGPIVEYELTEPTRALSDEVLRPVMGPVPAWSGGFHALLFSVPERERTYRDRLRRAAMLAGFGSLQPGVLITPDERRWRRLGPVLSAAPSGSRLTRAELALDVSDARAIAGDAWSLSELAARYRAQVAELHEGASSWASDPPSGPAALETLWRAMAPLFAIAAEDPALPRELLPADWPGDAVRDAVIEVSARLVPTVRGYVAATLAG